LTKREKVCVPVGLTHTKKDINGTGLTQATIQSKPCQRVVRSRRKKRERQ
jgi:hypothetical protein